MNNEIQKFDFRGASLRTLTDKAGGALVRRQGRVRHPRTWNGTPAQRP